MDDEKLIKCVRNSPCLYDKSHADFKNQEKKHRAWMKVANKLEVDESIVMRRWGNLRERFSKEIRNASGSGASVGKQWALLESLQFLKSHIIPRPMRQSAPSVQCSVEGDEILNVICEWPSQDSITPAESSPYSLAQSIRVSPEPSIPILSCQSAPNPPSTSRERKRKEQLDDVDTAILGTVKIFQEVCARRARREEFNTEIRAFGEMICSVISKMKSSKQALVMRRCTDIVMQAQIDEDEEV